MGLSGALQVFTNRRVSAVVLLGFASGLPLALTGGTLQAWYAVAGVDLVTIGFLGLVGQPYVYKFLWAPLMDRFVPPHLGRRRGWMLVTQLALVYGLAMMAGLSPMEHPWELGLVALAVAFFSASQDVAIDAWRTDVLKPEERGAGAAVYVAGYRIAMLVSGGLALVLADQIGWQNMWMLMAGVMLIGVAGTWLAPEPPVTASATPATLLQAYRDPLREFLSRPRAGWLLVFIVLYKLGDAYAGSLTVTFLIRGVGFTPTDVGLVNKVFGLAATLLGVFAGALIMNRLGLFRALLLFGLLQAVSNLGFALLAMAGHHYPLMVAAVGFENLSGGLGTAAFVALLMALCDHRYSASQFALMSALAAAGRVFVGPSAGYLVELIDWTGFFALSVLTALPGIWLLWWLRGDFAVLTHASDR